MNSFEQFCNRSSSFHGRARKGTNRIALQHIKCGTELPQAGIRLALAFIHTTRRSTLSFSLSLSCTKLVQKISIWKSSRESRKAHLREKRRETRVESAQWRNPKIREKRREKRRERERRERRREREENDGAEQHMQVRRRRRHRRHPFRSYSFIFVHIRSPLDSPLSSPYFHIHNLLGCRRLILDYLFFFFFFFFLSFYLLT